MNNKEIRRFLLNELPEKQRLLVEEKLLQDEKLSNMVAAQERDLLDEYVRGQLPGDAVIRLEKLYESSLSGRAKLKAARLLDREQNDGAAKQGLMDQRPPAPPWQLNLNHWRFAALLALAITSLLIWSLLSDFGETQPGSSVVQIELAVIQPRSEVQDPTISLSPTTQSIEILIDLDGFSGAGPFLTRLEGPDNSEIWSGELFPTKLEWGQALSLEIASERLETGSYIVWLGTAGAEETALHFTLNLKI
ncbi:MAG: hypothetical protein K0U98_05835 [Deltaproteobacteria bacterium]|nr:hypothetical protein [Deltaproteobacteria bacterium]